MTKLIAVLLVAAGALLSGPAQAAGAAKIHLDRFPEAKRTDLASLQNGARIFANHCLNCHSANLMRWNRHRDIGLSDDKVETFLIFGEQRVGDTMRIAMTPKDGKAWFGKNPPDLSVIVRARTSFDFAGTDYLYTLLRGYYRDQTSLHGWNNIAFPNIGMPHVMWEAQGPRETTIVRVEAVGDGYRRTTSVYDAQGFVTTTTEKLTGPAKEGVSFSFRPEDEAQARRFDEDMAHLVAYLAFMTDPTAVDRTRIGVWVLLFLALFTAAAWWLNRTYWRDIK